LTFVPRLSSISFCASVNIANPPALAIDADQMAARLRDSKNGVVDFKANHRL